MFGGVALSSLFNGEGAPPDIGLPYDQFDPITGSASFSLQFGPGFPCEFPSSATLTVQVKCASPSVDACVVAPFGTWTEPKADTFFLAGKASHSQW